MRGNMPIINSTKRKRARINPPKPFILLVPGAGIEPARHLVPRDFKSLASTISATRALDRFFLQTLK